MQEFEVVFYDKPDGSKPALEFVLGLNTKMRAKMFRTIEMLEKNGNKLRKPASKPLGDGIMELRAKVGLIYRVCFTFSWSEGRSCLRMDS